MEGDVTGQPKPPLPSGVLGERPLAAALGAWLRRIVAGTAFYAGHLRRRDPHTWVFGNHKGFRDSPRYLAEYLVTAHPTLETWWIARTEKEAQAARAAGLRVALRDGREAARVQQRAGVAFICNGFMDLQLFRLGGARIVHLYHGTPLKRISLDVDYARFSGGSRLVRGLLRLDRLAVTRRLAQVDMVIASGELAKSRFVTAFNVEPARIHVLGWPRFDVIRGGPAYERVAGGDLRARLGLQATDRVALWLPTWRERGDAEWLPALDAATVEAALGGTDIVLVVKPHPYSQHELFQARLPDHPRVVLLPEAEVDVNCLLHIADMLVTDYSSAIFDFAILRRAIYFFAPDLERYVSGRDLYMPFDEVTGGSQHSAWPSLLAALAREAAAGAAGEAGEAGEGLTNAQRIADLSQNQDAPGACERIVSAVAGSLQLELAPPPAGEAH